MTPDGRVDPLGTLTIHADLSETLTDARVTWSVMCPGIIMDAGREPLDSRQFTYHFRPAQFAAQFQHFQVVDYATGNPALAKSVFIVIFVEGVNERGDKVHDVDYVMIRGDRIYRLPTDLPRTPESKAVLELENAVAPAPIVAHAK
ncbi:MAG: hypothetical protein M5R36_14030 [Deltaproteobacteria bacterium]|nr:hypothetical protein [Deltaproteobacteria bacterium]